MSHYRTFNSDEALNYARQHAGITAEVLTKAEEIGDGNLNLVFKIYDSQGVSHVVVKQALPYVRCVGESWPLSLDRSRLEAETLTAHYQYAPEHTVKIIKYDVELAAMIMEDLSDYHILRTSLINGEYLQRVPSLLADYLAGVVFYYSDFYLASADKKLKVSQYSNPAMCAITEALFFTDPYRPHPSNNYPDSLMGEVDGLQKNSTLRRAVAQLKHRVLTHAEALLHGDIHTGSVFVSAKGIKVIDAEFGFFGPIGFDCGTLIGNCLLNYCALPGLFVAREAARAREQRLLDISQFWQQFSSVFTQLAASHSQDVALATRGYSELFLAKIWQDSLGYAGTELIRRTIGLSHVADMTAIADPDMQASCLRCALQLGQTLILTAPTIKNPAELAARIRQTA